MTAPGLRAAARRLLPLLDLTLLGRDDTAADVEALCRRAFTPAGPVASVCVWSRFAATAHRALSGTGIPTGVVANFPAGAADAEAAAAEVAGAVAAGAAEVDVVFPWRALLAGNAAAGIRLVRACREACGRQALLKVILETGQLATPTLIRAAAEAAIAGGADFLKTSTGKSEPGATLPAAEAMLGAIAAARAARRWVGFKASGGIRNLGDAVPYLALYDRHFGAGAASAANFRIGASALLDNVLAALGLPGESAD